MPVLLFLSILFTEIDAGALLHLGSPEAERTFSYFFKLLSFFFSLVNLAAESLNCSFFLQIITKQHNYLP